ncbi:LuxR family transcriptional regulator [Microbacterium sp. G2-8]|uniref:helix-turn-helix transcriptional regulator n=1 Tax=Microbacterium sp. G2-8 TaxID=2842454 RepID=UPI001C8A7718|nr:LuxR family transcriptional regulator [Microbacterium sp. G2-8]
MTALPGIRAPWDDERVISRKHAAPLVARDEELATFDALLDDVRSGAPRTAVIAGEAGIGKSRLLQTLREQHDDVRFLVGHCVDLGEVGEAHTSITGALRPLVTDLGADATRAIAGHGTAALARIFPTLLDGDAAAGPSALRGAAPGPLHEAIAVLLEGASRQAPLVLAIEDLHWIDAASLGILRFLTRTITAARLLIVLTYRTEDIGRMHRVRPFLGELARDRSVTRLDLARLDRDATRRMAEELAPTAPTVEAIDRLLARSEGVPFYVEELVDLDACDDDAAPLPDDLRDLLLVRYARLPSDVQEFARHLAVGGLSVHHELLAHVRDDADITSHARAAIEAGLIVADPPSYRFRHALVREAIADDLLPGERERLHHRYATVYEELADRTTDPVSAAIAHHWTAARDAPRAFAAWIRAMREARASLAYASAAQHAEQALSLWDSVADPQEAAGMSRLELMGRAATYLRNAGETTRSLSLLRQALHQCEPGSIDRALLLTNEARALALLAEPGSIEAYREALATLDALPDDVTRARADVIARLRPDIMTALAGRLMLAGRRTESIDLARGGAALAHELGNSSLESIGANIAATALGDGGFVDESRAEMERARELAGDDAAAQLRYWVNASDLAHRLGEPRRAETLARAGATAARRLGMDRASGLILASNLADALMTQGSWDEAERIVDGALSMSGPSTFFTYLARVKTSLLLWRGRVDDATALHDRHRALLSATATQEMQSLLGTGRLSAELALARGDLRAAWREARVLLDLDPELTPAGYTQPFAWVAARVTAEAARSGDPELREAVGAGPALRRIVGDTAWWPTHEVWAPLVDAELDASPQAWARAVTSARLEGAPAVLLPHALAELGAAHLAAGGRAAAREALDAAIIESDRLGAGLTLTRAQELARAAGPRAAANPDELLTARERQVLALVGEGLTNRQIGERLFISAKTASVHVSAILRKLGASTRTEAAHLARDLG